jgi:hypothetical protein
VGRARPAHEALLPGRPAVLRRQGEYARQDFFVSADRFVEGRQLGLWETRRPDRIVAVDHVVRCKES